MSRPHLAISAGHSVFHRSAVACAVLALAASPAWSQQAPASPGEAATTTLSTVTVRASADASAEGLSEAFPGGQVVRGTRIGVLGNQDLMDTPFSAVGFTNELIQDQQARSVGDVLLNESSVRAARGFGNFQQVYFIRGLPVFSDDVAYNGLYGLVPRQSMATEFIERVEVIRGASAFIGGAGPGSTAGGGLGGLVNVVPKRAPNEDLNRVSVGVQSGGQLSVGADIARRFGPDQSTGVRLNVARRDGETGIDREDQKQDVFAIGLDWRSRDVRLSADLGYQNVKLREPRPSVSPPGAGVALAAAPEADHNFAQPWTRSDSRDVFGTVRGEIDLSEQVTAWAAFGARQNDEYNVLANPTLTNAAGDTTTSRFDNRRDQFIHTGELGVRGKFNTGSVGHEVSLAASSLRSKERNGLAFSGAFANNLYNPSPVAPPATTPFGNIDDPQVVERIANTSLSLSDTLSFASDTVRVTLGARHQTIKVNGYDYTTGVGNAEYDKSRVSPVAGVLVKVAPGWSVYGNYIEGLVKGDTASGAGVVNVGQIFDPYVTKQKEIGAKYDGGRIGGSVALFTMDKPSAYVENNVYGVFGEQRHQGLELNVYGSPVRSVRLLGGLTLLDAKQLQTQGSVNNGKRVIGVPKHQLNFGAEWDLPAVQGLTLDARVIRTGSQFADAGNTQALPAWTRVDVGARYLTELGGRLLTLRGRIENLTDKNYWASSGGFPGQGYMVLGAPRTFILSASVDF